MMLAELLLLGGCLISVQQPKNCFEVISVESDQFQERGTSKYFCWELQEGALIYSAFRLTMMIAPTHLHCITLPPQTTIALSFITRQHPPTLNSQERHHLGAEILAIVVCLNYSQLFRSISAILPFCSSLYLIYNPPWSQRECDYPANRSSSNLPHLEQENCFSGKVCPDSSEVFPLLPTSHTKKPPFHYSFFICVLTHLKIGTHWNGTLINLPLSLKESKVLFAQVFALLPERLDHLPLAYSQVLVITLTGMSPNLLIVLIADILWVLSQLSFLSPLLSFFAFTLLPYYHFGHNHQSRYSHPKDCSRLFNRCCLLGSFLSPTF